MRLSAESQRRLRAEQSATAWDMGTRWFVDSLRGDLGRSRVFQRPVAELMTERLPITARILVAGFLLGWIAALTSAAFTVALQAKLAESLLSFVDAIILCTPAAVLGFLALLFRLPIELVVAIIVFARGHTWLVRMRRDVSAQPWNLTAHAFGLPPLRILLCHQLPQIWPQLVAVMAASVTLAIGLSVPLEVVCDAPGLGQLAWRATLGRDLPLLLAVTLCMAVCSITAASVSDMVSARWAR
jgi:peptide/nickel transport system permease protein